MGVRRALLRGQGAWHLALTDTDTPAHPGFPRSPPPGEQNRAGSLNPAPAAHAAGGGACAHGVIGTPDQAAKMQLSWLLGSTLGCCLSVLGSGGCAGGRLGAGVGAVAALAGVGGTPLATAKKREACRWTAHSTLAMHVLRALANGRAASAVLAARAPAPFTAPTLAGRDDWLSPFYP